MFQGGLERGRVRGSMSRIPGAVTTNATNGAAHNNRSLFLTLLEVRCSARESIPRLSPSFWGQLVTRSAPRLVPAAPLGLYPRHCLHLRVVFSLNLSSHGVPVSGSRFPPSHKGTLGRIGLGVHSTPA